MDTLTHKCSVLVRFNGWGPDWTVGPFKNKRAARHWIKKWDNEYGDDGVTFSVMLLCRPEDWEHR